MKTKQPIKRNLPALSQASLSRIKGGEADDDKEYIIVIINGKTVLIEKPK